MRRLDAATVAGILGDWRSSPGPLVARLADAVAGAARRGDLPAGVFLPSERRLAVTLGVSRGTVVAAYDRLRDDGVVQRRHGSGTWVAGTPSRVEDLPARASGMRAGRLTGRFLARDTTVIDLGVSILPDAGNLPPSALEVDLATLERSTGGHGYQPLGLWGLRHRLAELHSAQGLPTAPEEIAVTTGAQQAIALVAQLLVRPGGSVVVERPTYPGAIDVFARAGARLIGVDVDGAGARVDQIEREAARTSAEVAYVVATCQNPTGATMPAGRRRSLAALAERGLWIVEDASLAHLCFDDEPPPPVAALGGADRTVMIGSLSKLLWGGLRVGWVRAPRPLIERLGRLKAAADIASAALSQVVALQALEDHDGIVEALRARYRRRADHLADLLVRHLPDWRFEPPTGGLSLWVQLPGVPADSFAPDAARHGVAVLPGSAASVDDAHPCHLRMSFALPPELLDEAVRRLSVAWAEGQERSGTQVAAVG